MKPKRIRLGAQRPPNPNAEREFVPYDLPHPERSPFILQLAEVASRSALQQGEERGSYSFYVMGDVGGIRNPEPQHRVVSALRSLSANGSRFEQHGSAAGGTLFAYILGDVVYNNGSPDEYLSQFYVPYAPFQRPILAIPGNHDGDPDPRYRSLEGFIANFCTELETTRNNAGRFERPAVDLPNVYWTLDAPWLRIIGLYSNVPEGGFIEDAQRRWFLEQLERPRHGRHLVITVHQPVFSCDTVHGGSEAMFDLIHEPAKRAGCRVVISGHVHNFQRFYHDGMTYLVHGAGGYHELHAVTPRDFPGAVYPLASYAKHHSFLHASVTPEELTIRAIAVPPGFTPRNQEPLVVDHVTVPL